MSRLVRGVLSGCLLLTGTLLLLTGGAGCAAKSKPRQPRVPVTVTRATVRDVPWEIVSSGTVEARQTAGVSAQVGGVVTRIAFREGDEVQAGQALVEIDPKPFRAALDQARAVQARDQAQYESARLDAGRARELLEQNYTSAQDADQKRAAAEALHAAVRADSAAVATARLNLGYATVRAPFTGRTGSLRVHVGDLVKAADPTNPLVTMNQIRPILVRFTVPERDLGPVLAHRSEALKVEVRSGDSDSLLDSGTLTFLDNAVDPATGTLLLKAEFANRRGLLWPGQFVSTRLVTFVQKGACVVPQVAVTTMPSGAFVYVLQPDTTVAVRQVTVARTARNLAVISRGLQAGESVVTDGQFRLAAGSKVSVKSGAKMGLEAAQ